MLLLACIMTASLTRAGDMIKTEIVTLSLKGKVGPYYYVDKDGVKELPVSRHGIGSPIRYHGSTTLGLYLDKPSSSALKDKKHSLPQPDLQVRLSNKTGRVILLFSQRIANQDKTKTTTVRPFFLSNKTSSKGDYLVFNLSKRDVYISLDKKRKQIKPMKQSILSSPAWKKQAGDLQIALGQKQNKKIKSVYNSVWGHRPSQRAILFVYDRGGKKGGLGIRRYYDHPSNAQASR